MAAYPGAVATFAGFTSTHTLAADNHAAQHNLEQGEIVAVQTKIGTGASTPASNLVLRGNGSGTSAWAQVALTTDVTGILPIANGGTGQSAGTGSGFPVFQTSPVLVSPVLLTPTLSTPTITDYTNATHTHANAAGGGQLNGANAITDGTITPAELASGTGSDWAWQSWAPSWTNASVGNGIVTASYTQIGKTVHFRLSLKLGTTTNFSGIVLFTLPIVASAFYGSADNYRHFIGGAEVEDNGVSNYAGFTLILGSTTTASVALITSNGASYHGFTQLSNTVPTSLGNGDLLTCVGTYEAA